MGSRPLAMAASSAVMTAISEGFGISEVQRSFGHSSRVTAPLSGNPQTLKEKLMFNIRWLTGLTGLALSLAAFLGFFSSLISLSLSGVIFTAYLCPIGLMVAVTEAEMFCYKTVIGHFPILRTHAGRGFSYIFIGGLALSVDSFLCMLSGLALLGEAGASIAFAKSRDQIEGVSSYENVTQEEDLAMANPVPAVPTAPLFQQPQQRPPPAATAKFCPAPTCTRQTRFTRSTTRIRWLPVCSCMQLMYKTSSLSGAQQGGCM